MEENNRDFLISDDVCVDLIDILYKNSNQNFDACAVNLIQVFSRLGQRVPGLENLSDSIQKSIQVFL